MNYLFHLFNHLCILSACFLNKHDNLTVSRQDSRVDVASLSCYKSSSFIIKNEENLPWVLTTCSHISQNWKCTIGQKPEQYDSLLVPKHNSHHFSCRMCCFKLLLFRWVWLVTLIFLALWPLKWGTFCQL